MNDERAQAAVQAAQHAAAAAHFAALAAQSAAIAAGAQSGTGSGYPGGGYSGGGYPGAHQSPQMPPNYGGGGPMTFPTIW